MNATIIARYEAAKTAIQVAKTARIAAYTSRDDSACGAADRHMEDMQRADAALATARDEMAAVQYLLSIHFSDADRFPA